MRANIRSPTLNTSPANVVSLDRRWNLRCTSVDCWGTRDQVEVRSLCGGGSVVYYGCTGSQVDVVTAGVGVLVTYIHVVRERDVV